MSLRKGSCEAAVTHRNPCKSSAKPLWLAKHRQWSVAAAGDHQTRATAFKMNSRPGIGTQTGACTPAGPASGLDGVEQQVT